ncbi:MAG: hypothetical protein IPO65_10615 [Saprospiraceae bacterium]|nr:hypothetical protein [Saprospiraceae bacterium]
MEEIEQVGTGTGFAEALFKSLAGFACAVGGCGGGYFFNAGDCGNDNIGFKSHLSLWNNGDLKIFPL